MVVIYRGTDVAIQSDSMAQQQGTRRGGETSSLLVLDDCPSSSHLALRCNSPLLSLFLLLPHVRKCRRERPCVLFVSSRGRRRQISIFSTSGLLVFDTENPQRLLSPTSFSSASPFSADISFDIRFHDE